MLSSAQLKFAKLKYKVLFIQAHSNYVIIIVFDI